MTAGLAVIMALETLAGVFGLIAILVMLANIRTSAEDFARGKAWMILACLFAILVWGVGFMVIAGDWFLSWQAPKDATQLGAMVYFLPCALALIMAMLHRDEDA